MSDRTLPAEHLVDAWRIHARIQLYVLDAIAPEALVAASSIKGRTVGAQFAHIHGVRLMWLKSAAPDLHARVRVLTDGDHGDHGALRDALVASGEAIEELIMRGVDTGKIKGFKPHPLAFVTYLVAHESYHQGDIGVRLTQSGHPLDKKTAYGMWEWGTR